VRAACSKPRYAVVISPALARGLCAVCLYIMYMGMLVGAMSVPVCDDSMVHGASTSRSDAVMAR